ncbi:MAG: efflux RND transporter periplasmic adaptor subunit, partial [Candidatus Krumholzibacteriota bacterium]|nr:efflux RND transporter periplasmic adaptor subunit [Candidatus Krumholzibacteriota bacterium]
RIIARLDAREYEADLEESRARYLQALSVLSIEGDLKVSERAEEVRDEFSNLEKLERQGKITREERAAREIELDLTSIREGKFRYEVAAARSGVSEARASLERARISLERTVIRAPFSGVITGLTLSPGEQLIVNETICTLIDNIDLEAEIGVLEADLGHVIEGKPALLDVPALDTIIPVTVDVVSPQFDRETRTCQVLLRITNKDSRIRPGMFVRAQIAGRTFEDRLLVPREAILTRDGRPLLFKVEDGRAMWLYVTLGERNDYLVEVTKVLQGGTLEPGDKVIVSNHLTLAHEAKIKVKKTLPVSDPWVAMNTEDE